MLKKSNTISNQPKYILKNKHLLKQLHFEFCNIKKKSFFFTHYKASVVKYPLFSRQLILFNLRGHFRKKHLSKYSMNQTITVECLISKNKLMITSPTNSTGITVF